MAESTRERIIQSVFSKRNASGNLEESYVAHIKIWEDADAGARKPRYILLSQASNGNGFIHKSKLNTNGTFSVGKTWRLADLRGLQVADAQAFNITLTRTYRWQTESSEDQAQFLQATVRLFRTIANGQPLQLDGVPDVAIPAVEAQPPPATRVPSPPPPSRPPRAPLPRAVSDTRREREPSPARRAIPPRTDSPAGSLRDRRPPSLNLPPEEASLRPSKPTHQQRTSNATSIARQAPSLTASRSGQDSKPASAAPPPRSTNASPAPQSRPRPAPAPSQPQPQPQWLDKAPSQEPPARREQNARISYFDPSNQALLDRLLTSADDTQLEMEGEEETAQAILTSVEEMLEGYEWASDDILGRKMNKGTVDLIEARLLDELTALEKANVHSFLEADDRVALVMKYMDDALTELDNVDSLLSTYKIHLNTVGEDIDYIQSQNRGLQVQTQNQRALLNELQNLLRTVHVDRDVLIILTQESLEKTAGISRIEEAAVELYKALQAGKDTDMAATMERLQDYRTHNGQFCKRVFDFLSIMFVAQSKLLLGDNAGIVNLGSKTTVAPHRELEAYLSRYSGLMLYVREMDEANYSKICASYFSSASDLYSQQTGALLTSYLARVKKGTDEDQDQVFSPNVNSTSVKSAASTMKRAGTLIRSPLESRQKERDKQGDSDIRASESFGLCLEQIANLVYKEDEFISSFLHINDATFTFADYMGLDNYFRRQANRTNGLSQNTIKLVRGALDLIFGFLPATLKTWLDSALGKDNMEIIGILVFLERYMEEADEKGNFFVINLLEKQHSRLRISFERHTNEQLKVIEQTKLTVKKRKGVAPFIKNFLVYAARVEQQLAGADSLEVRSIVNSAYDKVVQTMFDSLKQIAKQEGEGEDKGQLNYHVIMIENMHHFVAEISSTDADALTPFARRAETIYEENLSAYIKIVFRRPFGKLMDFFDGAERAAKESNDLSSSSSYSKSALKRVLKEFNGKDIRKLIELLGKRVVKHFTEASDKATGADEVTSIAAGTVLVGVWKACEEEFLRLTESYMARISQSYGDSGVGLEYSISDVKGAFGRMRV